MFEHMRHTVRFYTTTVQSVSTKPHCFDSVRYKKCVYEAINSEATAAHKGRALPKLSQKRNRTNKLR